MVGISSFSAMELNSIFGVVLDTEEDAVEVARCKLLKNECDDFETTSVIERVKEFVSCFVFDLTDEGITKLDKFLNGARERFDNGEPDVAFVFEKVGDGDLELLSNVFEDDFLNALFLIKVGEEQFASSTFVSSCDASGEKSSK